MSSNEKEYPYSVKIEQSAKGARVTVHVNGQQDDVVMSKAVALYQNTRKALQDAGQSVAPDEGK